jgi:hypothetical protein
MTALLVLPMSLALVCIAPGLGLQAQALLGAELVLMLGTGRLVCRAIGYRDEPFIALIVGFVLFAHALVLADRIMPGAHWVVAAAFAVPALAGFRGARLENRQRAWAVAACVALFTLVWNSDVSSRLALFHSTGRLNFWVDVLVHAGNLAGFATHDAVGRGLVLMADTPAPFYHYGSLLPSALLTAVTGTPPLDAIVLAWIPLGVLIMACGVAALGLELGGSTLACLALAALALVPSPERWTLGNGYLGFAWLIETSPGLPYSLGVACAALAALVRWMRDQQRGALALAVALAAGCLLIRANTFVWLAPTIGLGVVAGWRRVPPRPRLLLVATGLLGLAMILAALSWPDLRADPERFLFGFTDYVLGDQRPTRFDHLYPQIIERVGHVAAGVVGIPLILLGILGPWLPAFVLLGFIAWRRRLLGAADALPLLLLLVATLAMLLAPTPFNGDMTEFRHRAGPFLVAVLSVWSLRLGSIVAAARLKRLSVQTRRIGLFAIGALSVVVLAASIGDAKRPRMTWAAGLYASQAAPELLRIAPLLSEGNEPLPRFAVANQPSDTSVIDDAVRLVALSGVPAYIARPAFAVTVKGSDGDEARRRMAVIGRLAAAVDLSELRSILRAERITHYVVTSPNDAAFDPERREAVGHVGTFAVYLAVPPAGVASPATGSQARRDAVNEDVD